MTSNSQQPNNKQEKRHVIFHSLAVVRLWSMLWIPLPRKRTMRFYFFVGLFQLIALLFASAQLQQIVDFRPENCDSSPQSKAGDMLYMHYTGTIDASSATGVAGKKFDSSRSRGPFNFKLGAGSVIKGWDQGLAGMCVGKKFNLLFTKISA